MPIIEMQVEGMTCGHCVQSVTKALQARDAHARVVVDLAAGLVSAETMLERASAVQAIESSGYKVLPCNRA
ncbi:cation transporter [Sediminicoccus sp. KRV36]|uniref:heavy-metal-associated domain-containing protein n=1 Tax=Sediminicoccus sp. KRV36 TaxID=3133721 RepID=UPI00200F93D9|nr:cation transporter [Sediminicoccus rosea]UPY35220.1 cation transporter [Sediminicoccus rosea]